MEAPAFEAFAPTVERVLSHQGSPEVYVKIFFGKRFCSGCADPVFPV